MRSFKDNQGRSWTIQVTVDTVKRVRGLVSVDLLEIVEGTLIDRLMRDPILLCDVVYAVCKPEAESRSVTDEEFGRAMAGDAIEKATHALLESIVDFFQNARDRENLRRVLEAVRSAMNRTRDLIEQRVSTGELDRIVESALATAGPSSTSAPGSSDSIQDR